MKLTKEDVYISLKGKTKEELTDLWEVLDNSGEKQYSSLKEFINESDCWDYFIFEVPGEWTLAAYTGSRKEVTIKRTFKQ